MSKDKTKELSKLKVETETGSIYLLDEATMTWKRIRQPDPNQCGSFPLRTQTGNLSEWPEVRLDQPMMLIGPPLNPLASFRLIETSHVVSIERVTDGDSLEEQ